MTCKAGVCGYGGAIAPDAIISLCGECGRNSRACLCDLPSVMRSHIPTLHGIGDIDGAFVAIQAANARKPKLANSEYSFFYGKEGRKEKV